ncbi:MAG: hypothetical protein QXD86_05875 [Candidatus Bathyarchaeia archaeon]
MSIIKFSASPMQVLAPTDYTALSNPVYKRVPKGSILLCLSGSGAVRVFQAKSNFSGSWNLNYSNKPNVFDDDLGTYASYLVPANTLETDALVIDYNSVAERYLLIRLYSSVGSLYHRIYVSNNGVEWNLLFETNNAAVATFLFKSTFRYVKITVRNIDTTSGRTSYLGEIMAFTLTDALYTKSITYANKVVIDEIQCNPYWVWVEPNPIVNLSIYEKTTPSSASEIWVF